MCIAPVYVAEVGALCACKDCWQCRANRVNDLIGRCIAEQRTSTATLAVTLTYGGGDVINAAVLVYDDFQRFLKRLRRKTKDRPGYDVRYIVAGEYGGKKGRAHWHAILFFKGAVPDVELEKEYYDWPLWNHGYSYFQQPDYKGFAYLLKYAMKDQGSEENVGHLGRSKIPPLGTEYFEEYARRFVEQNLSPQSYEYSFPDVFEANGKRRKFMLQGKVREIFMETFLSEYSEKYGKECPVSEIVNEFEDKHLPVDLELAAWMLEKRFAAKKRGRVDPIFLEQQEFDDDTVKSVGTYKGIPCSWTVDPLNRLTMTVGSRSWHVIEEHRAHVLRGLVTEKSAKLGN